MFKLFFLKRGIRFRRFCHKAYAAFCSLHREVTIGRLAGYMTDLEMLKQGKRIAVSALLLFSAVGAVDADEGVPDDSFGSLSLDFHGYARRYRGVAHPDCSGYFAISAGY